MRKALLSLLAFGMFVAAVAQTPKEDLRNNVSIAGANMMVYPGPKQQKLTPSPKGKKPFYISHYGRHGSRYLTKQQEYDYVFERLQSAKQQGKLTSFGENVLAMVALVRSDAGLRLGDLTPLGEKQQKEIARRMYERFPEVFAGKAFVDARSTTVVRCVLSMDNALGELIRKNPRLKVSHTASMRDFYYLNQQDRHLADLRTCKASRDAYEQFCNEHLTWKRIVSKVFNDMDYVDRYVNGERFNYFLFKLAVAVLNTEMRDKVNLCSLFTEEEIYENWQKENVWWYLSFGATPLCGSVQPYVQRNLLRKIIEEADSCIRRSEHGASLRFGHETCVLPLVCLLGLNGYGLVEADVNKLEEKKWWCHEIFPMSSNVQFVFYRSSPKDDDVLIKVLLNENEATLPLTPVSGPYYRWTDFRDYFLKKLDAYEAD